MSANEELSNQVNILAVFLVLSIMMLIFSQSSKIIYIRSAVQNLFIPSSKAIYSSTVKYDKITSFITTINNLADENSKLKKENIRLTSKLSQNDELKRRLGVLEKELSINGLSVEKKYVVAAVVGRSPSASLDVISIDKGSQEGIKQNQPALSEGFLIGKVLQVNNNSSQIELISSHHFLTPVILQNSRTLGLIRGGLKGIQIEQLPIDSSVIVNEVILTSGLAGEFPAGLAIGTVKEIISKPSDIFKTVTVETPINFKQIEIVMIIN